MTTEDLIAALKLRPHPAEGGFFCETYRATEQLPAAALPPRYGAPRAFGTAIYYLLTEESFSAMHRLQSDEVFHFYLGDPVTMLNLDPDGSGRTIVLGPDIQRGMRPQVPVPAGVWQGARLLPGGAFALLGTTVAPGFDFADFELADRATLVAAYPQFEAEILALTRG